jgi:hypothetical protein
MDNNMNTAVSRNIQDLLEMLACLEQIEGVQDYLLVNYEGEILARKPGAPWDEDVAAAYAKDMAQAAEVYRLLSAHGQQGQPFDFRFEGAQFMVWDFGRAHLVALCGIETNQSIARMTVNVIKEDLRKDKRFKDFFLPSVDSSSSLLTEQEVGSELYQHVAALKE